MKEVSPFIDIHTHHASPGHLSITSLYELKNPPHSNSPDQYFSIGLHPWYLNFDNWEQAQKLLTIAANWSKVIAFGECGLDRHQGAEYSKQIEYFEKQIEFFKLSPFKVCFIHCVRAWNDILPRISPKNNSLSTKSFILHDFNSSLNEFEQILKDRRIYFSLGKNFLRSNSRIHKFVADIPLERIFFESDDSGTNVESLYQEYLKYAPSKLTLEELKSIVEKNYQQLFNCS